MPPTLSITITDKLSPSRWSEYRDLRIDAIQTRPDAFLDTLEEALAAPDSLWQERLEKSIIGKESAALFAVNENDELVGITVVLFNQSQQLQHLAKIVSVFVTSRYQGQGVGRQLLEAAIARAQQNPAVTVLNLEVNTSNEPAHQLYKSLGFVDIGVAHQRLKVDTTYYDEYEMELLLKKS